VATVKSDEKCVLNSVNHGVKVVGECVVCGHNSLSVQVAT
jgi:hypothetical protein